MKKGFNMIELVFVIVILGILASIAIPKLIVNKDDAEILKAKTVVSSVRSYIQTEKNNRLLAGISEYPELEKKPPDDKEPFNAALSQKTTGWTKGKNNSYTVEVSGKSTIYKYNKTNGDFTCPNTNDLCNKIEK